MSEEGTETWFETEAVTEELGMLFGGCREMCWGEVDVGEDVAITGASKEVGFETDEECRACNGEVIVFSLRQVRN